MSATSHPSRPGLLRRFFRALWRLLDTSRRVVLNLLFLGVVLVAVFALFAGSRPRIGAATALVLDIRGPVVEQATVGGGPLTLAQSFGETGRETLLRDVVAVLDAAAKDPRIPHAVLVVDEMQGAGLAKLREIAAAMERFKASGKAIVAWGSSYGQAQYYLAAHASEVYLHPQGLVTMRGFGRLRNYYKDLFDRIGVQVNVIKVGRFKSFAEPYVANAPSEEATEADAYWLDDAWAGYLADVEKARRLQPGTVMAVIDDLPARLAAAGGNIAKMALDVKLVDGLKTRDELRAMLIERGARDATHETFRQVPLAAYRATVPEEAGGDAVAVLVAAGEIVDDAAPAGTIGGRTTAELVRQARERKDVKALVVRIDSPGGSAFGSELVRRELEVTRKAGKPVVVSMGDVAASGGYWIASGADRIFADRGTITGSIGVFMLMPSIEGALAHLDIRTGGHTTTWLGAAEDVRRPLDPRLAEVLRASVGHTYQDFLQRAATARNATPEKIGEVAEGRVWTGRQAKDRGLVDDLGGLREAVATAGTLAGIGATPPLTWIEREPEGWERVLRMIGAQHAAVARGLAVLQTWRAAITGEPLPPAAYADALTGSAGPAHGAPPAAWSALAGALAGPAPTALGLQDLRWLVGPTGTLRRVHAHCLCGIAW